MVKKNNKSQPIPRIFTPPGPHDPLGNFLTEAGNIAANKILLSFSSQVDKFLFGQTSPSLEDQYRNESYNIALQKQQVELAKAQTQQLKAAEQLKLTEFKVADKELQLEKTKQQSTGISIERTELDLHVRTEVISGTLDMVADSGGLMVPDEQKEACQEWQASLPGSVGMVLGKRGSGKSSTGARIGELMQAAYGIPFYWLGIPEDARELLPSWVRIVDSLEQCPNNCFILVDEGGLNFLSLKFADKRNIYLRQQLMLCRQKNWIVVFCVQSSRDIDESIIRQSNWTILKEPGLNAASSERREVRDQAIKASQFFKQIPKEERVRLAYVFDENFEGIIRCSLPSFWSEELSNVYGHVNQLNTVRRKCNQQPINSEFNKKPKLPPANISDEQILELRREGYGYERISKELHCSVYRVRMCLAGNDPLDDS